MVLALPASRSRWLAGRLGLAVGGVLALSLAAGLLAWAGAAIQGAGISLATMIEAGLNCLPAAILFLVARRAALRAGSARRHRGSPSRSSRDLRVAAVERDLGAPDWLRELSPFEHVGLVPAQPLKGGRGCRDARRRRAGGRGGGARLLAPRPGRTVSFGILAVIVLAGLGGPLLAMFERHFVPVVIGEILAGILVGPAVLGVVDPHQPTAVFLSEVGFAMLMLTVGMHLPLRDRRLAMALRGGAVLAALVVPARGPGGPARERRSPAAGTRRSTRSCSPPVRPPCCCPRSRRRASAGPRC